MPAPRNRILKGKTFEYEIGEYHLRLVFEEEDKVHWYYRSAPGGMTGKNSVETIDRIPIRENIILMAWKEADGTNVLDILDLAKMELHVNFVTADGTRTSMATSIRPAG